MRKNFFTQSYWLATCLVLLPLLSACSSTYYGVMEQVGIHKRDILRDRVEAARDSQSEAKEQFKSALEQFSSVVYLKNTDLKMAYEKLNDEYENSRKAAEEVSDRIKKVESVAEDLFDEWEAELHLYQNKELRRESKLKLQETKNRYKIMLNTMVRAEKSMQPVLLTFHDNVLFVKHNLNAQAIGSLRSEFSTLQGRIETLIQQMKESIESSNRFISQLE